MKMMLIFKATKLCSHNGFYSFQRPDPGEPLPVLTKLPYAGYYPQTARTPDLQGRKSVRRLMLAIPIDKPPHAHTHALGTPAQPPSHHQEPESSHQELPPTLGLDTPQTA